MEEAKQSYTAMMAAKANRLQSEAAAMAQAALAQQKPGRCPVCFGSGGSACQHLDGSWFCGAIVMGSALAPKAKPNFLGVELGEYRDLGPAYGIGIVTKMDADRSEAYLEFGDGFKAGFDLAWVATKYTVACAPNRLAKIDQFAHAKDCGCFNCYRERGVKFHGVKLGEYRNLGEHDIWFVTKMDAAANQCTVESREGGRRHEMVLALTDVAMMPIAMPPTAEKAPAVCQGCGGSAKILPADTYGVDRCFRNPTTWNCILVNPFPASKMEKTPAKPKCISCGQVEPLGRDGRCWECGLNVEATIASQTEETDGRTKHQRLINRDLRDWAQTLRQPYTNSLSAGLGVAGSIWRLR